LKSTPGDAGKNERSTGGGGGATNCGLARFCWRLFGCCVAGVAGGRLVAAPWRVRARFWASSDFFLTADAMPPITQKIATITPTISLMKFSSSLLA